MSFASEYSELRKKRKKSSEELAQDAIQKNMKYSSLDIAPVLGGTPIKSSSAKDSTVSVKGAKEDTWFQAGAFDDGYQFGDVTKSVGSTVADAGLGITKGALKLVEGVGDLLLYGAGEAAGLFDKDAEDLLKEAGRIGTIDKIFAGADNAVDKASFLGKRMEAVEEGLGQVAGIILTGGLGAAGGLSAAGTTALTTGVTFASSMGSGIGEAYEGGATDGEAWGYGALSGTIEAGTELIFGGLGKAVNAVGLSKGISSLDDAFAKKLSSKISSQFWKNATEFGVKAGAEGAEEVLAGIGSAIAKDITYMSEKDLGELIADENLLDQFIVGAVTSGIAQSGIVPGMKKGSLIESVRTGRDLITGFTANEQKVVDKEVENRIKEAKEKGDKVDNKAEAKIRKAVEEDLQKGYISTDTIEEVFGGEHYTAFKELADSDNALANEERGLKEEFDALNKMKQGEMTGEQVDRREELRNQITEIGAKRYDTQRNMFFKKAELSEHVQSQIRRRAQGVSVPDDKDDKYLLESYNEVARRGQAFEADTSQYDEKQAATVQKAIDSGILNNSRRTHEFVDTIAKIAADRGVSFDFTNNAKLKESGFAIDGKQVNGFVTKDGITINVQSPKAWQSTVGHEITHVLEGTELYTEMQSALYEYAKTKKDYDGRRKALEELYKDVKDADIDAELTADLVGDYLFQDSDFVNHLSVKHRNVFQKIYDEIKHLLKMVTSDKEKRELEKVKHVFDKVYRESGKVDAEGDAKYSLSDSDGKKLTKEQGEYFKDSKMRDENGNLKVMYHGSQDAGFHVFDPAHSDDDTSLFFVDRNDVAASYSGTTETYEAQSIRTAEDMNKFIESIGAEGYEVVEKDGKFTLLYEGDRVAASNTAKGIYEEFCWYEGVGEGDANYKVYLNLTNPLEIDAKGRPWNKIDAEFSQEVYDKYQSLTAEEKAALTDLAEWEDFRLFNSEIQEARDNELASAYAKMGEDCNIYDLFSVAADNFSEESMRENARKYLKTRDFAQRAKDGGYDGVIFKNIHDNGGYSNGSEGASTVAIAFDSNQIKSVANEKPTGDPDIRYSLTEYTAEEKKAHNDAVLNHFGKTYSWAETGYLLLDGTRLDLSGKHDGAPGGYRTVDHRDITEALGYDYGGGDYSGSLVQFMSEGNIRIIPECNGINLSVKPTEAQERALSNYISRFRGEVMLDIDDLNGNTVVSVEYPRGTYYTTVLNDIREWFDNGKKPEASTGYSLTKEGERQKRYGDFFTPAKELALQNDAEAIAPVKEDIAPAQDVAVDAPEKVDEKALFPDDVSVQQLKDEMAALLPQIEAAYKANDREGGMPLYERYQALTAEIKRREAEDTAMQDERFSTLTDADVPPEVEAPYYGEGETLTADDPFENRDMKAVSKDRKTKAYMYENPEVKPFFQSEAAALLGELERTEKPQTYYNGWMKAEMAYEFSKDIPEIYRTKRVATPDIVYLRDTVKMSYADIEKGLKAIIEDNGAENIAAAKKIEFVLNDRLLNGYTEDGFEVPPNQDYINLINEKQISEYSNEARKQFFEVADEYAPAEDIAPVAEAPVAAEETVIDAPMAEAYEAIKPKRERKQTSEPRMKRADSKDGKQRKWVGTSTESDAVDGKILPDDLDQSKIHYQPISNKKTLNDANTKLNGMGYDAAVAYFNSQFSNKKTTVEDIVLGERLIQEAIKRGDTKTAGELIEDVAILGTELGQKVQALSIIKRLTPEGQLRMLKRTVERGKTKGDKAFEGVEITQEMIDHILKTYGKDGTYDQAKLNKAVEDVKQQIADQMKVTKLEKVNAWRYLSMLGNPKTHIRNLVSNVAMRGTVAVKNVVARTIESFAPVKNRTKTWQRATEDVKAFAQQTTEEMKDILMDGGKYNEETSIKEKRQIFENKILNGVYEFNSNLLSKEDWWFSKPAFNNALSEFLTANGIRTAEDIKNNPEIVEKAKKYATEQAQIATFRQYSWLANKINEIERKNTATNIAVGAVLPFKKTPINIAKTGLSYSPLGFMKTLTYDISQVKKGDMEASTLVDHLSQNITGTALALLGYMLANSGFLNGGGDDDKEGDYDYQLGKQAYSINVGGATYSLSWLSPVAMPLFVGANAYEQLVEGKEWNGDVVVETLAQTLDPLSEMSFLSSLDSVLSSYDSGVEKFAGIAESAAQNYITQFAPTLLSQVATVTDDTKRSTKAAADSDFKFVDETINKLKYKIPGLRQTLEPTTDIWGNEVKQSEGMLTRAFETFLAPYSKREDISSAIDEEIKDLYSETGDTGVVPSIPYNYVNYDGVKYEMSAQDFTAFKQTYGQTAYEMLDALFATETYKNADSDTRADMVNDVYDYARDLAKQEYLAKYGVDFYNSTEDGEGVFKENPIRGAIEADLPVDEYSFSVEYPEKYKFFNDNGISYSTYKAADEDGKRAYSWAYENPGKYTMSKAISDDFLTYYQYKSDLNDLEADKDGNGKSISGSKKKKVISYINDMDLDYGQKIILLRSMYDSADDRAAYNADIVEYLNSRNDISYDEMVTILKELGFTVHSDGRVTWD